MGNWFSGVKIEDLDYFDAVVDVFREKEKYLKTKDDFDSIIYDMTKNDDIKKIIKKGKKAYDYYSARPDIVDRKRKQKYLDKFFELEKKFSKDFQTYRVQKKRQTQGQTTKQRQTKQIDNLILQENQAMIRKLQTKTVQERNEMNRIVTNELLKLNKQKPSGYKDRRYKLGTLKKNIQSLAQSQERRKISRSPKTSQSQQDIDQID